MFCAEMYYLWMSFPSFDAGKSGKLWPENSSVLLCVLWPVFSKDDRANVISKVVRGFETFCGICGVIRRVVVRVLEGPGGHT